MAEPTGRRDRRRRSALLELLLVFGLPLAALVAGAMLLNTARHHGFTAIEDTPVAPKGS